MGCLMMVMVYLVCWTVFATDFKILSKSSNPELIHHVDLLFVWCVLLMVRNWQCFYFSGGGDDKIRDMCII